MKNNIQAIIFAALLLTLSQIANAAAPANDTWQTAESMTATSGTRTGTTSEATAQPCEPVHLFPDDEPMGAKKTVWYKWFAPFNGSYTFKVASSFSSSVSVYRMGTVQCGVNTIPMPVRITENRAFMNPATPGSEAQVTFAAQGQSTYYIAVDGYGTTQGAFTLSWERTKYSYNVQLDPRDQGTDLVITRNNGAVSEWWFMRGNNINGYQKYGALQFGRPTDIKLLGDFDGDGLTDFVAVRPENGHLTWWIINRDGGVLKVVQFGLSTDRPIVGDYDGDRIADIAVTRNDANNLKTWHILRSSDGSYYNAQFGITGDREMVGDFDGDGRTDIVVLRPGATDYRWYTHLSGNGVVESRQFGRSGDVPQAADVNNDGRTDLIMFRLNALSDPPETAGKWYMKLSGTAGNTIEKDWGQAMDRPQIGDYDGDGIIDLAVFRAGIWWLNRSHSGAVAVGFGNSFDRAMSDLGLGNSFLTMF